MAKATVMHYRVFELPWTPSYEEERRLKRVLGAAIGLFIGFGVVIPLLPTKPPSLMAPPAMPERVLEFILEQPKPKPVAVPPKPVEQPKVEAKIPVPRPVPPVARAEPQPDPRKKAAASGLLAMTDQLAELRNLDVSRDVPTHSVATGAAERM